MSTLRSAQPNPELRPYVRAYAQRKFGPTDLFVVEPVPAQLEQVLNFEFGTLPGVRHRQHEISAVTWIGGAQTSFAGYMDLHPGVESFAQAERALALRARELFYAAGDSIEEGQTLDDAVYALHALRNTPQTNHRFPFGSGALAVLQSKVRPS